MQKRGAYSNGIRFSMARGSQLVIICRRRRRLDVHVDDDAPVAGIARGGRQSGRHTSIWLAINHNANRQRSCRRHPGDKLDKHIESD